MKQGRIQDFDLGGGGAQNMWVHTYHEHKVPYEALSCYLSLIFKLSDTKWDTKHIVDQILEGGGAPVAPPLNLPLWRKLRATALLDRKWFIDPETWSCLPESWLTFLLLLSPASSVASLDITKPPSLGVIVRHLRQATAEFLVAMETHQQSVHKLQNVADLPAEELKEVCLHNSVHAILVSVSLELSAICSALFISLIKAKV